MQVEATGETVGEAKWAALRELEQLAPGLDKAAVRFQVVSEGERGLLGVGYAPARVIATVDAAAAVEEPAAPATRASRPPRSASWSSRSLDAIGVRVPDRRRARTTSASPRRCSAATSGSLIGKHGQTIDAIQYLANAIVARPRRRAQGGRRGRGRLPRAARGSARRRSRTAAPSGRSPRRARVELEPMTAVERKVVHAALKDFAGVETRARARSRTASSSSPPCDRALARRARRHARADVALRSDEARRVLLDERLAALEPVRASSGPIVDVGSGGGAPGIPLAAALPEREVTLLEATRASATSSALDGRPAERARRLRPRRGAAARRVRRRASRRRSRRRRSRRSGACRSSLRAVRRSSSSARPRRPTASRRSPRARRRARARLAAGPARAAQARPDAAGLPAPPRRRPETSARAELASRRARPDLRAREPEGRRRQDDDRDQPRRLPRRGRRADARRRPRPAGERDLGARRARERAARRSTCSTAPRCRSWRGRRASRTSTSCRRSPSSPARPSSSRGATTASATSPTRSPARREDYAFVFLDCPPSLGPLTVNALAAADRVLVPVQAEYYALEGLAQLVGSVELVRARLNPRLALGGVLLTMVDGRTRLSADVSDEVRRHFGDLVFRTSVPRSVRLAEAPSHGLPVIAYDRARPEPTRTGRWRWSLSTAPERRRGLGRGLEVLIGGPGEPELAHLPVETIHANPRQPRRASTTRRPRRSPSRSARRASSSRCVVRPADGRRLRADRRRAPLAGRAGGRARRRVPALVREADDRDTLLLGLVENVAREELSAVEEARAYAVLLDEFELSLGELAERVGRSKPTVSNRLRLLELPDDVLGMVERGELTEGHARAVLAVPGPRRPPPPRAPDRPAGACRFERPSAPRAGRARRPSPARCPRSIRCSRSGSARPPSD